VSAVVSWEIAIKVQVGKLQLPEPPAAYMAARIERHGATPLPVEHAHALRVGELPLHHRDPFDRLLVAQAQVLGATLLTADHALAAYEVDLLWADMEPGAQWVSEPPAPGYG
jgi:PIN domain nuclease of toxin-antitoxin system